MSNDVLIGALLSIPIGIATGVAVIPIQKWLENRGKEKALVQRRDAQSRYITILFYRLHPHLFTQYLLQTVIKTTFTAAAVGIVAGFIYAMANLSNLLLNSGLRTPQLYVAYRILQTSLGVLGQMTAIASSILIIGYCRPALKLWYQVRHFEEYAQTVAADIRNLPAEAQAESVKEGVL